MFETVFDLFISMMKDRGFSKQFIIRRTREYLSNWEKNEYEPRYTETK